MNEHRTTREFAKRMRGARDGATEVKAGQGERSPKTVVRRVKKGKANVT